MTPEEAIEYLDLIRVCDGAKVNEALNTAIEALQKHIPMKPIIKLHTNRIPSEQEEPYCPHCDEWIGWLSYESKFCDNCGQALKWED